MLQLDAPVLCTAVIVQRLRACITLLLLLLYVSRNDCTVPEALPVLLDQCVIIYMAVVRNALGMKEYT
jgi:hypothetical protein